MKGLSLYCFLLYAITLTPLLIWTLKKINKYGKISLKENLLLFLPFLSLVPCLIEGQRQENQFFRMTLAGKIISTQNLHLIKYGKTILTMKKFRSKMISKWKILNFYCSFCWSAIIFLNGINKFNHTGY